MEQSCGPWQLDLPLKLRQFPLVGFSGQQAPWSAHIVQQGRKNLAPCQNHLKSLSFKVHPINSLHSEATLCSYRETEIPKYIESIFIFPFSPHFIQSQILQGHSGRLISAEMAVSRVGITRASWHSHVSFLSKFWGAIQTQQLSTSPRVSKWSVPSECRLAAVIPDFLRMPSNLPRKSDFPKL